MPAPVSISLAIHFYKALTKLVKFNIFASRKLVNCGKSTAIINFLDDDISRCGRSISMKKIKSIVGRFIFLCRYTLLPISDFRSANDRNSPFSYPILITKTRRDFKSLAVNFVSFLCMFFTVTLFMIVLPTYLFSTKPLPLSLRCCVGISGMRKCPLRTGGYFTSH